jgi:hypothetical protein
VDGRYSLNISPKINLAALLFQHNWKVEYSARNQNWASFPRVLFDHEERYAADWMQNASAFPYPGG